MKTKKHKRTRKTQKQKCKTQKHKYKRKGGTRETDIADVTENGLALQKYPLLQKDKEVALLAVRQNGRAMQFVPAEIRDREMALIAVNIDGSNLRHVPEGLIDREMALIALKSGGYLASVPEGLRDREMALIAVNNGESLTYVPAGLRDREMALIAVNIDGSNLRHVPEGLIDREMALIALKSGGYLSSVPAGLRDREMALIAVNNGESLAFVPEGLRNDKELVYEAILNNPFDLKFASPELRNDKVVVYKAVSTNGMALQFASPELRNDKEIVYTAVSQNPIALQFASDALQLDPDLNDIYPKLTPASNIRGQSETSTNQTNEPTCGRHAFSKVIMKNIFEVFYPLTINDPYMSNACNKYLTTGKISKSINNLTEAECSHDGYIKILLILHLIYVFISNVPTLYNCPKGYLYCSQVTDMYPHLYAPPIIPNITDPQREHLTEVLTIIQEKSTARDIHFITFQFQDIDMLPILRLIAPEGLYAMLFVEDTIGSKEHSCHALLITGLNGNKVLIKNSWSIDDIYEIALDKPIHIKPYIWNKINSCTFVIPVMGGETMVTSDESLLSATLDRFRELKISLG
jgi:hypothetical protein